MFGGARCGSAATLVVFVAALLGCFDHQASAAQAPSVRPLVATFDLPASVDLEISFVASERREGGSTLRFGSESASASYSVRPDLLTRRRLEVDYGSLGSISLRFRPDKKQTGRCDNKGGTFTGTIRFEAEGVPLIDESRVEGQVGRPPLEGVCIPGLNDRSAPTPAAVMHRATKKDSRALFSCDRNGDFAYGALPDFFDDRGTIHVAVANSRLGRVDVQRHRIAFGPGRKLRVSRDGRRGRVDPPRPFTGSARFRRGRLTGDLSVPMLGIDTPVALTPAIAGSLPGFGRRCDSLFGTPDSGAENFGRVR